MLWSRGDYANATTIVRHRTTLQNRKNAGGVESVAGDAPIALPFLPLEPPPLPGKPAGPALNPSGLGLQLASEVAAGFGAVKTDAAPPLPLLLLPFVAAVAVADPLIVLSLDPVPMDNREVSSSIVSFGSIESEK